MRLANRWPTLRGSRRSPAGTRVTQVAKGWLSCRWSGAFHRRYEHIWATAGPATRSRTEWGVMSLPKEERLVGRGDDLRVAAPHRRTQHRLPGAAHAEPRRDPQTAARSGPSGSPISTNRPRIRGTYRVDDGVPVEVIEDGPSVAARFTCLAARLSIRPVLAIGSRLPFVPWPWGLVDLVARALPTVPGTLRDTVRLANCTAELVRANGVLPADGMRRIVLYFHGGGFLMCGAHTHGRLVTQISRYADAPVLLVNYRMMPKHSLGQAVQDCHDGYQWLREIGYSPTQIVLAGDSAGGYLALVLAERLLAEGEQPAALVAMSPLMQLRTDPKTSHPNVRCDAMFVGKVFDTLAHFIHMAAARKIVDGEPEEVFEPLDHVEPGLANTVIHVSGSELLLHDARLAAHRLARVGVPVEVTVWPGQLHAFQVCAPYIPETNRSLRRIGEYIREATASPAAPLRSSTHRPKR
jgi:acetyl esterase/lipase